MSVFLPFYFDSALVVNKAIYTHLLVDHVQWLYTAS